MRRLFVTGRDAILVENVPQAVRIGALACTRSLLMKHLSSIAHAVKHEHIRTEILRLYVVRLSAPLYIAQRPIRRRQVLSIDFVRVLLVVFVKRNRQRTVEIVSRVGTRLRLMSGADTFVSYCGETSSHA